MIKYPITMIKKNTVALIEQDRIIIKDEYYNERIEPIRLANSDEEEAIRGHINSLYLRGYKVVEECKETVMKLCKYESRFLWK